MTHRHPALQTLGMQQFRKCTIGPAAILRDAHKRLEKIRALKWKLAEATKTAL